jgi:hypothetical protein
MANQIINNYKLLVPPKISKIEYLNLRKKIPAHIKIDIKNELFKEWNPIIIIIFIILFPLGLITGILPSISNYYGYLVRKQNYYNSLFKAIYDSKSYEEYVEIWSKIEPKENYLNRIQKHMEEQNEISGYEQELKHLEQMKEIKKRFPNNNL